MHCNYFIHEIYYPNSGLYWPTCSLCSKTYDIANSRDTKCLIHAVQYLLSGVLFTVRIVHSRSFDDITYSNAFHSTEDIHCTVEPPITDTPRSGQPLYNGQTL